MNNCLFEILKGCKGLKVYEQHALEYDCVKLIIYANELDEWNVRFKEAMGDAMKPEGQEPLEEHIALTKDYGGIATGQTLYKKDYDDAKAIVMLWPWSDDEFVTLHMKLLQKQK